MVWNLIWGSRSFDECSDIEIDSHNGVVYVAGNTDGSFDGQTALGSKNAFVSQIRISDSRRLWTRYVGSTANAAAKVSAAGITQSDTTGELYLVGTTDASMGGGKF